MSKKAFWVEIKKNTSKISFLLKRGVWRGENCVNANPIILEEKKNNANADKSEDRNVRGSSQGQS